MNAERGITIVIRVALCVGIVIVALFFISTPLKADCPGNLLFNPGFEEGYYRGVEIGTSVSSHIANGWNPWAILGDPTHEEVGYNFEPEYKILVKSQLVDGWYRVLEGEYSQAFFSMYSTHTAGFYQRVKVPKGSRVTFSIWVQIYTGQEDIIVDGLYPVSDLYQPLTEPTRSVKGAGNYRVWVGIDPYGNSPAKFGDPPPDTVVWSDPVLDVETRTTDAAGRPVDDWVELRISTIAQADWVTVYTKGQPEYRTKHNDSFWDMACLIAEEPGPPTPFPTRTFTPTQPPTATLTPTLTPTPFPTATLPPMPTPTSTLTPTPSLLPSPTVILEDAGGLQPSPMVATPTPEPQVGALQPEWEAQVLQEALLSSEGQAHETVGKPSPWRLVLLYGANAVLLALIAFWVRSGRRH